MSQVFPEREFSNSYLPQFDVKKKTFADTICFSVVMVVLLVMANWAHAFCYDNPSVLETDLLELLNVDRQQYSMLYSIYSIPNIFFPIFGGMLLDAFGFRAAGMLFISLIVLGQSTFVLGVYTSQFSISVIGRFIFGSGSECLLLTLETLIVKWFFGNGYGVITNILLSVDGIIGGGGNFILVPLFVQELGMWWTLFFTLMLCICSFIAVSVLILLDYYGDKWIQENNDVSEEMDDEKVDLKAIFSFNLDFWMICAIGFMFYGHTYTVFSISFDFLINYWELDNITSGYIASMPYVGSFMMILVGYVGDKWGHKGKFLIVTPFLSLAAYLAMLYTDITPIIIWGVLSIAYSLGLSAITTLIPTMIYSNVGTAYGLFYSLYNLSLTITNFLFGTIIEELGYRMMVLAAIAMSALQLIITILMYFKYSKRMDMNEHDAEDFVDGLSTDSSFDEAKKLLN